MSYCDKREDIIRKIDGLNLVRTHSDSICPNKEISVFKIDDDNYLALYIEYKDDSYFKFDNEKGCMTVLLSSILNIAEDDIKISDYKFVEIKANKYDSILTEIQNRLYDLFKQKYNNDSSYDGDEITMMMCEFGVNIIFDSLEKLFIN